MAREGRADGGSFSASARHSAGCRQDELLAYGQRDVGTGNVGGGELAGVTSGWARPARSLP